MCRMISREELWEGLLSERAAKNKEREDTQAAWLAAPEGSTLWDDLKSVFDLVYREFEHINSRIATVEADLSAAAGAHCRC